jgi:hypothetical protein
VKAGVGNTTAVDVAMLVAAMSLAALSETATVRAGRFAACAILLVVTPVAIVTMHSTEAARVVVAAVRVRVAEDVPEFTAVAVKVVEPHAEEVVGDERVPK